MKYLAHRNCIDSEIKRSMCKLDSNIDVAKYTLSVNCVRFYMKPTKLRFVRCLCSIETLLESHNRKKKQ